MTRPPATAAEVPAALAGERVDRVVSIVCGVSRSEATDLVAAGRVRVNGKPVLGRSHRVSQGEMLEVDREIPAGLSPLEAQPDVEVAVVFVDDDVVVVDKPAGLAVHPGAGRRTGTLANGLLARFPEIAAVGDAERPGIVHRLDVGTSGLMVVARNQAAYESLVEQMSTRSVDRRYLTLAWGEFEAPTGVIDAPVGRAPRHRTTMAVAAQGKPARTAYTVLDRFSRPAPATLLECRLETGRTHQVRVHLAAIGHPVVGDSQYGGSRPSIALNRPFLHAFRLGFDHPADGGRRHYESPLPSELEEVRELFR